jgi:3-methyladenine DNA glycosylase AlkD
MSDASLRAIRAALRAEANADDAVHLQRFFKTGPGEYAEGDRFLGVRVPATRRIARAHRSLPRDDMLSLLRSEWHEERLLALLLLVDAHSRGTDVDRAAICDAYLAHTRYIDNWDLVDSSAAQIVGPHVPPDAIEPLERLARSQNLWERRIAIIATFHWIRAGEFAPTMHIAEMLLHDSHDLIHKAVGWMLREVGNRGRPTEEAFLRMHCRAMPRTMLRYAIEKFPEPLRKTYLAGAV